MREYELITLVAKAKANNVRWWQVWYESECRDEAPQIMLKEITSNIIKVYNKEYAYGVVQMIDCIERIAPRLGNKYWEVMSMWNEYMRYPQIQCITKDRIVELDCYTIEERSILFIMYDYFKYRKNSVLSSYLFDWNVSHKRRKIDIQDKATETIKSIEHVQDMFRVNKNDEWNEEEMSEIY